MCRDLIGKGVSKLSAAFVLYDGDISIPNNYFFAEICFSLSPFRTAIFLTTVLKIFQHTLLDWRKKFESSVILSSNNFLNFSCIFN